MCNTLLRTEKIKLQLWLTVLFVFVLTGFAQAQLTITRYVRAGGSDFKTGTSPSTDPSDPSGAYATIQRAIDEFDASNGYINPTTGLPVTALPFGTTYIIDVGAGIYNDPGTIFIPPGYAKPGTEIGNSIRLIVRGPKVGITPNQEVFPGGPTIREYNPATEAIIQTSYGAGTIGGLRTGHRPLRSSTPGPFGGPAQNPLGLGAHNEIFNIGKDNFVTFQGLYFEASPNNGGGIRGGRIFEVDNRNTVVNESRSTSNLEFTQNVFIGLNQAGGYTFDITNANPLVREVDMGLNSFQDIVSLKMDDNRFMNVTWDGALQPYAFPNNGKESSRAIALNIYKIFRVDVTNNHFIGRYDPPNQNVLNTMDLAVQVHSTYDGTTVNFVNNQVSNNRGGGIYVDNSGVVQQDFVNVQNNRFVGLKTRDLSSSTGQGITTGITVMGSRSANVQENRLDMISGSSIFLASLRQHALSPGKMHTIWSNIITMGNMGRTPLSDGITMLYNRDVEVKYNTITDTWRSGVHVSDFVNNTSTGFMQTMNIMITENTIRRANRGTAGPGGEAEEALQSGGIAIFSHYGNTLQFNTTNKIYVTKNIIDRASNSGIILRNNNLTTNSILLVDPTLSLSNYYKKDIRFNKNILIENGGGSNGAGLTALIQNGTLTLDGIFGRAGQVDATANWWGKTTGKVGPNDNDNPLNLGAGTGQRVVEFGSQTNVALYSPWLGSRVSEIGTPSSQIDSNGPDDDPSTPGVQIMVPTIYYGSELFGLSPTFFTPQSQTLYPTVDVGGVTGMINKAITHAKSDDIIEMYRGLYPENVVVPVNFGTLTIRAANFNSTKMVSVNTSCSDATQMMKMLNVKAPSRPGVDPPFRGVGAPVATNACNTDFRVPFISDASQEATIKQIATNNAQGAALNIQDGNNLLFEGFRLLTVNNQAVNSNGANTAVKFMNNLIEVETPNKNNNGVGLVSFNNHDKPLGVTMNVFRGIAGQSELNAVALNIYNCDTAYVAMNSFAGQQIMSSAIRIDRSSGATANALNVEMNDITGTYYSAILVLDDATMPTRNVRIANNEIIGNNTLMSASHAGITFTMDNANSRAYSIMYNNIRNNKKGGILARSGNVNGRRIMITYNVIHNNDDKGLVHNASGRLDATGNWWGSSAGPDIVSNKDNNGTALKGTPINDIFGGGVFPLTPQQKIDGSGRNSVAYSPWLGGQAEDQTRNPKMIPDPTVDPLTNPNPPMIDNTDPPNGLFPYRGELDNSALYNGTLSPDRDANSLGVQFKTPFATFEAFPEQNAWYIGVVTAGVGSPNPSSVTNAAPSFFQRSNDLSLDGDDIYTHDDDYTGSAGPAENVIFTKGLTLAAAMTTKNATGAVNPTNRPSSKLLDITVRNSKVIDMLTDYEVRDITLAGANGMGSIYTFPHDYIVQRFTVASLPAAETLPRMYQLYAAKDLNTLTFSGNAMEDNNMRYVIGSLKRTVNNVGTASTDFGKIGYALLAGAGANSLGNWTVTRTAGTKNQQPTYPAGATQFNTDFPDVEDLFEHGFAPDPRTPPQLLRPDISPFIVNGFHSIDRGYKVEYTGAAPTQGWSIKMNWVSDNDPFVLDNDNNASTPNPAYQYPATMIVRASKDGGNTWPPLMPYDVVTSGNPRNFPTTPGITLPINATTFANNQALFTILDYDPTLKAYAGANRARCIGDPGLVLGGDGIPGPTNTTARGGLGPYKYSWTPSTGLNFTDIANPTTTATQPGTYFYTVTVTDAVGFTAQSAVTIFVNPKPTVEIGPDRQVCVNDDIQLLSSTVTGGRKFGPGENTMGLDYLYYWTSTPSLGGALNEDQNDVAELDPNHPDVVPGQQYTITLEVEDANGCVQTDVMKLIVNDAPMSNAGANKDICIDGTHVLGGSPAGSGGTGALSYMWTLKSKRTFSNTNIPFAPGLESSILSATNVANPTFTPNVAANTNNIGNYTFTLTVTDANGCSSSDDIRVGVYSLPKANAGADMTYCYTGGMMTLGANPVGSMGTAPYMYMWSSTDANSSTSYLSGQMANGQTMFTAPPDGMPTYPYTFMYKVTVTDAKGCMAMDDVMVKVYPELVANGGPDIESCVNSQYIIGGAPTAMGGSGNYAYEWTPNHGLINQNIPNNVFTANPVGQLQFVGTYTYTVTVTDLEVGCVDMDEVVVVIKDQLTVNAGTDRTICAGLDVPLNAIVPGAQLGMTYVYSWSPATNLSNASSAMPVFNSTVPGTYMYTVTVTDLNNCIGKDMVQIIVYPNPIANAGPDRSICIGGEGTLNGSASGGTPVFPNGYTYVWSPVTGLNAPLSATTQVSLNFPGNYSYTLTVRDANQCVGTDVVMVSVFTQPVASAGSDITTCAGQEVMLNGSATGGNAGAGYQFTWIPNSGVPFLLTNENTATPSFTSMTPGVYSYIIIVTDANGCTSFDEVSITVNAVPTANAGADRTICAGASVSLNGSGTGTTAFGVLYFWSPAARLSDRTVRNPQFTTNDPGTYVYTLQTTDVNGCTATDQVTVVVNANPVVSAGADKTICAAGFTVLDGSAVGGAGGYMYNWSPNANLTSGMVATPTFTTMTAGNYNYTLTVTDANNCSASDMMMVTVLPRPMANAGPDRQLCVGQSVNLQGSATGGVPGGTGYLYSWTPITNLSNANLATPTYLGTNAGSFFTTLTVTDANGCSNSDEVVITVNPLPVANAGFDKVVCQGASVTLDGSASAGTPGPGYNYSWMPGANLNNSVAQSPVFSSNVPGIYNYTLMVTDSKGCSSSDLVSVTVLAPAMANAGSDHEVCAGMPVMLMGSATGPAVASYMWSPADMLDNAMAQTPMFETDMAGTYMLTLTTTDVNGCKSMDETMVIVNANPMVMGGSFNACVESPININGSVSGGEPAYSYMWSPATRLSNAMVASPVFISAQSGSFPYTLTVTDANGCMGMGNVMVNVAQSPMLTVTNATQSVCKGNSVMLSTMASGGAGGYTYNWSPAANLSNADVASPMFFSTTPGTYMYTVTVMDANGCSASQSVTVVNNFSLSVNAGSDVTLCSGGSVQLNGSYSGTNSPVAFSWNPPTRLSNSSVMSPTFTSNVPGTYNYTLTVSDANGCSGSDQVSIVVANNVIADAGADKIICRTGSIMLSGSASSGSGSYSYMWSPAANLDNAMLAMPMFTNSNVGTYSYMLKVTDNVTGCSATDMMMVRVVADQNITLVATFTSTSCPGAIDGTITATALIDAGSEFQIFEYSLDGINWQSSNFFSGLGAGVYTVYTRNQANCPVSTTVTVQGPAPTLITNITGITESSALVTWTPGTAPGIKFNLQYRIIGSTDWTVMNNISGSSMMLTNLQNFTNYEVSVQANCNGSLSTWSPVASFRTLITATGSCKVPGGIFVTQVAGSNSVIVTWNGDLTAGGYTVSWLQAGSTTPTTVNCVSGNSFQINNLISGANYRVRVRVNCNSCPATGANLSAYSAYMPFTVDGMKDASVENTAAAQADIKVYPNPTRGAVTVAFNAVEDGSANVVVTDVTGRIVFEKAYTTTTGANELPVEISGNAAGVYMLKVSQNGIESNVKVVLQ